MRELFARWAAGNPVYLEMRANKGNGASEHPNPRNGKASEASTLDGRPMLGWAIKGNPTSVALIAPAVSAWATMAPSPEPQANQAVQQQIAPVAQLARTTVRPQEMVEPSGDDADAWGEWIAGVASRWQVRGWTEEQAYRIAWGYAENVRWKRHGIRPGPDCCAGCGETLDSVSARQIAEGVYVHDDGEDEDALRCQIAFGLQWRGAARTALVAMGLTAPEPEEDWL